MGIIAGEVEVVGATYGIVVDTVRERPIDLHLFECLADASGFLAWCRANGADVECLVGIQATSALDSLAESWKRERCQACYTIDCSCRDCGMPCTSQCADGCREGARP